MATLEALKRAKSVRALRIALVLVALLGAFVAGRSLAYSRLLGTWSGDSQDHMGRRIHLTMTFDAHGNESLRVEFFPTAQEKLPPPTVYRGVYFLSQDTLVQDLQSMHPIPEGMFYDRPLHEARVPSRELRCQWKVDGDRLLLSAYPPFNVVLTRVR